MAGKKDRQVKINLDETTLDRLSQLAAADYRRDGEMARLLIEWAIPQCERAGSIAKLRASDSSAVGEPGSILLPRDPAKEKAGKGGRIEPRYRRQRP